MTDDQVLAGIDHLAKPGTLRRSNVARSLQALVKQLGAPPEEWQMLARRIGAAARASRAR